MTLRARSKNAAGAGLVVALLIAPYGWWIASANSVWWGLGVVIAAAAIGTAIGYWLWPTGARAPSRSPEPRRRISRRSRRTASARPTRDWLGLAIYGGALGLLLIGGLVWALVVTQWR